jgi:hypothetical protein
MQAWPTAVALQLPSAWQIPAPHGPHASSQATPAVTLSWQLPLAEQLPLAL